MDKQTGSNSSSQGTSESRDISLGCGPSPASSAAAASSSSSSSSATSAGGGVGGGVATTTKFTSMASEQQHQAIVPSGSSISGTFVGPAPHLQHTPPPLTLNINTTTGGNFSVIVDASNTVENLRKVIAKKLKVAKDRICLLHREKELQDGTLRDNGLMDGSKIILIPNVETGLLAQRPENTVMQALESLNDSQVNDFLSGKTPLNLSMRLGDHMMLIQLQLSTVNPVNSTGHSSGSSSSSRTRSSQRSSRSSLSSAAGSSSQSGHNHHSHHHHHHHHHTNSQTSTSATTSVASTSVSAAPRKLDVDAANSALNAHTSHRPRMTSVSTIPSLRLPPPTGSSIRSSDLSSFLSKRDYESLQNIVRSIAMAKPTKMPPPATTTTVGAQTEPLPATVSASTSTSCCSNKTIGCASPSTATPSAGGFHAPEEPTLLEQSPIKSLSNLVSSPIKTTAIKNIPIASSGGSSSSSSSSAVVATVTGDSGAVATCQDAISAKLTSCLCTRLNSTSSTSATMSAPKSCVESTCQSRQDVIGETSITESRAAMLTSTPSKSSSSTMIATAAPSSSLLHKTANNPIGRSKHRHHHHHHHHHHHYHHHGSTSNSSGAGVGVGSSLRKMSVSPRSSSVLSTSTNDSGFVSESDTSTVLAASQQQTTIPTATSPTTSVDLDDSGVTLTDTRTLAEASRNLTQTLRKLSKEVFTNKIDLSSEETPRKSSSGAVIESMKNHGKGIYSGTFSGTLNPALQDRYGRPKRDISTVIHILNDLLSATPQYSRGARISFEAPSTSSSAAASTSSGHTSRNKQHPSKHHHHSYAHSSDSCVKCSKSQQQSSNSGACAYGECNGHYANTTSKQAKHASYACCQDLSAAASSHHHQSTDANNSNDRNTCNCRYRIHSETGEREREHMCQKCLVEMENNKTKSKLDQLRLVMQQRKQKREARKLKGAPYGARVVGATTGVTPSDAAAATVTTASTGGGVGASGSSSSSTANPLTTQLTTTSPSEVSPNHIVEEVDTAA